MIINPILVLEKTKKTTNNQVGREFERKKNLLRKTKLAASQLFLQQLKPTQQAVGCSYCSSTVKIKKRMC